MDSTIIDRVSHAETGASWYRCALQVNPYAYLSANGKHDLCATYPDETAYNNAMVNSLVAHGINVIGITDHWCVASGESLREAASAAGIIVFPGFEGTTKDGVHILTLFDPQTTARSIERHLAECGIMDDTSESVLGRFDFCDMLEQIKSWGAVAIAPHVATGAGLLGKLSGQTAIRAWTDANLHAVALSMPDIVPDDLDRKIRPILDNRNSDYRREFPAAVLHAADLYDPAQVAKRGASCWIKMSQLSTAGLDLAFRSGDLRVRLQEPRCGPHPALKAISWEGGFLDGLCLPLNDALNVLIGGRGSGKSTVIESVRYALDIRPRGETARAEHEAMVQEITVLGAGTKISILVECRTPTPTRYVIERTVPNPAVVKTINGDPLPVAPTDVVGAIEIYGQRELAELARDKERLTVVLDRYMPNAAEWNQEAGELRLRLQASGQAILDKTDEMERIDDRLNRLPGLEEKLARFEAAGVGERLAQQTAVEQERTYLASVVDLLKSTPDRLSAALVALEPSVELPGDESSDPSVREEILRKVGNVVTEVNSALSELDDNFRRTLREASETVDQFVNQWETESAPVMEGTNKILRELQPEGISGSEYLELQRNIAILKPLVKQREKLQNKLRQLKDDRRALVIKSEEHRAERIRALGRAAKKVQQKLKGVVQAKVSDGVDRTPLLTLIDKQTHGQTNKLRDALRNEEAVSLREFADICRTGTEALAQRYGVTQAQARAVANEGERLALLIEEVDLPITTDLELNVGSVDRPFWRGLDRLSTGQKATALLLLLLQKGEAPILIDQPEDDLDNRFIYSDVVPMIQKGKETRQLIFSSHNANIPVLGDADLIATLQVQEGTSGISGILTEDGLGSIDKSTVRTMVEELLEGGREAFLARQHLYGIY